jgi:hypothetical protein
MQRVTCLAAGARPAVTAACVPDVARDPVRHLRHPAPDQRPILVGLGGHQIEHVAHGLQRRRDHVQIADIQMRVMQRDLQTESFAHRRDGDMVDLVGRGRLAQFA